MTSTTCALEVAPDAVELHLHLLAAEHVLDADLAHVAGEVHRCPASSSKTVGSVRTRIPRSRHARTTSMRSAPGRRGDRDDHLVGLGLVEDLRQLARRAAHAHAVDPQPLLERVVVDEADRVQAELRVARELLADLAAALAGADDQHGALAVAASAGPGSRRSLTARASTRAAVRKASESRK